MNCDRVRELSSEAIDNALPREVSAVFRAHLEACPPCRAFVAELQESLALLGELPEVNVDDRFNEAVWARLRTAEAPLRQPWWEAWRERFALAGVPGVLGSAWRWAPLGAAATVLLVFALTADPGFRGQIPGSVATTTSNTVSDATPVISPGAPGDLRAVRREAGTIPEAVEAYLRNGGTDLRVQSERERLRGSDYSYPIRRVGDAGLIRVGTEGRMPGAARVRPVPGNEFTVISF